jgi:hypothetical protein
MKYPASNNLRPIQINFDAYGGNDDDEFKHELVMLMANSVQELKEAAIHALAVNQSDIFRKAAHKAKSTLVLLGDEDFMDSVEQLRIDMSSSEQSGSVFVNDHNLNKFLFLSRSVIMSLETEAASIKPSY